MKQIKTYSFAEVLAKAQAEAQAEQEAFDKMTPHEQAAYLRKREAEDVETQNLVQQLRGTGFMEIRQLPPPPEDSQ